MGNRTSKLDGDGIDDFRVYNSGGMSHDFATLHVLKAIVQQSPHRPLYCRRYHKRHEPECRPHHFTPAWVTPCATLHTSWNPFSNHHREEHECFICSR